jgi:uncharacterized protein (TIGR00251 family)
VWSRDALAEREKRGGQPVIVLQEHAEGWILPVRAQPGARKQGVMGEQNGALKLAVNAPADDGRANKALVALLRELLGVRRSQVELLKGGTSRDKKLLIRSVAHADLERRIAALCVAATR